MLMDLSELRELIRLFERAAVSELEYETEGVRIRLRKEQYQAGASGMSLEGGSHEAVEEFEQGESPDQPIVPAPMVGVFYQGPAPDAPPFVQVGDFIEEGQTVCIIEAMKLMNEVRSSVSGKLVRVLVGNGEPVEFGQPLFVLESADT
jgi:acetyl-CoA carboxylase biotin carboxyl carrier protein